MGAFEYKAADVSGLLVEDEGEGIVTAIVSVTGMRDSVNDIIEPGAYKDTLEKRLPKGIWHHDWHQPVSKTLEAEELMPLDPRLPKTLADGKTPWPPMAGALLVKQQFNLNTDRGRTAYEDVKFFGPEQEWSIGYKVVPGKATRDPRTGTRHIKSLDLFEYSPVLVGTMPMAHTLSVKSAQEAFKSGEFTGYDPAEDAELKTGEGIGLTDDDVEAMLAELIPQLTELQGYLTQKVKRDREREIESDRLEDLASVPVAAVKSDPIENTDPGGDDQFDDDFDDDFGDEEYDGLISMKSLTEAVFEQAFEVKSDEDMDISQETLVEVASDVDYAIEQEDDELLDEKAAEFLDLLEEAIDEAEGEQKNDLRLLAQSLAETLDRTGDVEQKADIAFRERPKKAAKRTGIISGKKAVRDSYARVAKGSSAGGQFRTEAQKRADAKKAEKEAATAEKKQKQAEKQAAAEKVRMARFAKATISRYTKVAIEDAQGGVLLDDTVSEDEINVLKAAGWKGDPKDGREVLYPPKGTIDRQRSENAAADAEDAENEKVRAARSREATISRYLNIAEDDADGAVVIDDTVDPDEVTTLKADGWKQSKRDGKDILVAPASYWAEESDEKKSAKAENDTVTLNLADFDMSQMRV